MIGVLRYGSGNVAAISNLLHRSNIPHEMISPGGPLSGFQKFILPGVGAFDTTVELLRESRLLDQLEPLVIDEGVPLLGICVGMQILASSSEEGQKQGLGWIPGKVARFLPENIANKPKVPHLGWNSIAVQQETSLFDGVDNDQGFYFLHSFHFVCEDQAFVLSTTDYGGGFVSAVRKDNVFGVQFHPEKSHRNGVSVLENFCRMSC